MNDWTDLSIKQLRQMVPKVAGLHFVGCPNCTGGLQETQLSRWTPNEPDVIRCVCCGMAFPNKSYPDNKVLKVKTPGGNDITYPYYENEHGYRYYFTAALAHHKRVFFEELALKFAKLYLKTNKPEYGKKAALILHRFSQVWPDYCWHYDYPFKQAEWIDGYIPPEKCKKGYRTARFDWWGYLDISMKLLKTYEIIKDSPRVLQSDVKEEIKDFFKDNANHLIAQKTALTNMHPRLWKSLVLLGRLLDEPFYLHAPIPGIKKLLKEEFFADGVWHEGSPDYFRQTVQGLVDVCRAYGDYKDPNDYQPNDQDIKLDGKPVENKFPILKRALKSLKLLRFPFGHSLTLHDSWGWNKYPYPKVASDFKGKSFLLPNLGHACLSAGHGESVTQVDFTWSGCYGHAHMDGLSMMLTAWGREMLSDIGYTHTKYRSWTLTTAAHNTVVIDHKNQNHGGLSHPTDGNLVFALLRTPGFQVVKTDNCNVYPEIAKEYNRTLIRVGTNKNNCYVIDRFKVKGGTLHDYFLHGDCISKQTIEPNDKNWNEKEIRTLLSEGTDFKPPTGEHNSQDCHKPGYAYAFLKNIKEIDFEKSKQAEFRFKYTGTPVGENDEVDEEEKKLGLQIITQLNKEDRFFTGANPSVRQAKKDDNLLDQYNRPFVMLRRSDVKNNGSVFVTLMEPYNEKPDVKSMRIIRYTDKGFIMQVNLHNFTDYVFLSLSQKEEVKVFGEKLILKGSYGYARFNLKTCKISEAVAVGEISYENLHIKANGQVVCELLDVTSNKSGGTLTVKDEQGNLKPKKGDIITLRRDKRVTGLCVTKTIHKENRTIIQVSDNPGFNYNKSEKTSTDTSFPNQTYKGTHEVCHIPIAIK